MHTQEVCIVVFWHQIKILVFKEIFSFSVIFYDRVLSLISGGIIFLGVGKALCFGGDK